MKKKICRSERLPKYGTPLRTGLVSLVATLPDYQEGISKGFPLFTKEDLDDIEKKYKDGLTWEDIDRLLSGKGIFFKKATFRKYIQEGNISKATGYQNTEKGRVAIFSPDTISHINFIQYYYKVMDGKHVDNIINLIENREITYLDAINFNIENRTFNQSIRRCLCYYDEGETEGAIAKALKDRPDDREKFLKMLKELIDKLDTIIGKEIGKFETLLKKKTMSILEIMGSGGDRDEKN